MTTLVTGGTGLVGSFIPFGLKPTKNILNLLHYTDVERYIEQNNISSIIHTAAKVGGVHSNTKYVFDFFIDNIGMNTNILKACQKYDIKKSLFMISTCAFPKFASLPLEAKSLHQGEPHESNYGYAYAKRMIEVGARALRQQYNLTANTIIPCNLYGEHDNYHLENGHVIPGLIHKCYLAKQNRTRLEIWGSGNAEREFVYAKDIADIIFDIHHQDLSLEDPMIISPETIVTIKEIVEYIVRIMKFNGSIYFDTSKPEGILRKNSSNIQFRKYFPNFKFTSLEEGLGRTIEYFLANYSNIRKS